MAVRVVSPGERRRLPVAVSGRALQLRSAAAAQRRTALAMTEKENAETVEKSAEEIMALNLKLGDAAEAGDAELIRQLVEDGADVEYAPFVPDEEDDDEDDQDGDYSTNATEGSVEGTASVENPAPDVTVAGDGQFVDTCGVPGSRNLRCGLIPVLSLLPCPAPPALSPCLREEEGEERGATSARSQGVSSSPHAPSQFELKPRIQLWTIQSAYKLSFQPIRIITQNLPGRTI